MAGPKKPSPESQDGFVAGFSHPPLLCLQCLLKAYLAGAAYPPCFDETRDEHLARVHPDPEATRRERVALEAEFARRSGQWN